MTGAISRRAVTRPSPFPTTDGPQKGLQPPAKSPPLLSPGGVLVFLEARKDDRQSPLPTAL
jgi:hypothetical protein